LQARFYRTGNIVTFNPIRVNPSNPAIPKTSHLRVKQDHVRGVNPSVTPRGIFLGIGIWMFIWMMNPTLLVVRWLDLLTGAMHGQAKQLVEVILHDAIPGISSKLIARRRASTRLNDSFAIEIWEVITDGTAIRDATEQVTVWLNEVINSRSSDIRSVAVTNRVERG
jgi:hypothetical protein